MYETGCMSLKFCQFSCFLEIFQKPPDGHSKSSSGSCYFYGVCGFQRWDRLAALPDPPSDAWRLTSFLGFCLNCLAVMINRQATRTFPLVFGIFGVFHELLSSEVIIYFNMFCSFVKGRIVSNLYG